MAYQTPFWNQRSQTCVASTWGNTIDFELARVWELYILRPVHMGFQVPLMLTSPNMETKSQLLNLKKPFKYGLL